MKTDVSEEGYIRLKDLANPVILVAEKGKLSICERDGIFEVIVFEGDRERFVRLMPCRLG